jgi:transcriptional regulator with XRE-family HTH domain
MATKNTDRDNDIRQLKAKGSTQKQIADAYGISQARVSQILSGYRRPAKPKAEPQKA